MSDHAPHLPPDAIPIRGTAVTEAGRALLITGPTGSGKSTLALELISRGARLIGDDLVLLRRNGEGLCACAPPTMRGVIEVRGVGLVDAPCVSSARLIAQIDLSRRETERLPPRRDVTLHGQLIRLFHAPTTGPFAAALHVYLLGYVE